MVANGLHLFVLPRIAVVEIDAWLATVTYSNFFDDSALKSARVFSYLKIKINICRKYLIL